MGTKKKKKKKTITQLSFMLPSLSLTFSSLGRTVSEIIMQLHMLTSCCHPIADRPTNRLNESFLSLRLRVKTITMCLLLHVVTDLILIMSHQPVFRSLNTCSAVSVTTLGECMTSQYFHKSMSSPKCAT